MKYIFIFSISFIFNIKVHSQALHFFTGSKIEDYDEVSFHFFDQDSLYLYAFHQTLQSYFLDVYEKESLNRTSFIKIPLPSKDTTQYTIENLFIRKDTFQIFYSFFDYSNFCERLDMITFDINGIKIGETKIIDQSTGKNEIKAGNFSVINRKRFNEFISYGYKNLKDTSNVNIDHFDYSGNKKYSQNFLFNNNFGYIVNSLIDNDCNLYHLTRNKSGNRNVNWNIRIYSPDIYQSKIIELNVPSIQNIYLSNFFKSFFDNQGRVNILSPYSLSPTSKYAEGVYLVQLDSKTQTLIKESAIPFKVKKENDSEESDFSLSSCIIVATIPYGENNLKIVFESRLETTATLYGIPIAREFDIGNIFTIDIDSSNEVKEIHKIRKQQLTSKERLKYTGFSILNYETKSYFIYNELPENLLRPPNKMKIVNSSNID